MPEAYVFETGRNVWHKEDAWPPRNTRPVSLYFHADGKLSFDASADDGFDEYISDPSKPVPYINGQAPGMKPEYMIGDQRFAATRPDVLVYETDPLPSDITVAGPLTPSLFVSTSGTDSDFVVKLIDVYLDDTPDNDPNPAGVRMGGYEQLVRGEPMRGRFRKSYENPQPFVPGDVDKVEYTMPDVYHTFRRGHRIMVQVQSSWFPLGRSESADVRGYLHRQGFGFSESDRARVSFAKFQLPADRERSAVIRYRNVRSAASSRCGTALKLNRRISCG